jgi:hypothetical protein
MGPAEDLIRETLLGGRTMATKRCGSSGLTRADVLVVLALAVFLLAAVGPLASKPRAQARRIVCKANLGKIGKAMFIYANDYEDELPRPGGLYPNWGRVVWNASDRYTAHSISPVDNEGGRATISSCFYLLVKYLEMPPRVFVCPGDRGTSEFKLADEDARRDFKLSDAWDFGPMPADNCSYAYHMPFSMYALSTASDPNLAVAADRNPWIISPAADVNVADFANFTPDVPPYSGTVEGARQGNAISHEGDGQNVLFLDGRVAFEHRSFCGVSDDGFYQDNIYTWSTNAAQGDPKGLMPMAPLTFSANRKDSLLVHDPPVWFGPRPRASPR